MGADRKLANWDKLLEYYQLLAKSSNRVKLVELGKSQRGPALHRPVHFVAGEPRQARSAAAGQREVRRSARARRGRSEEARWSDGKAVTVQSFGLHSTEVASAQTAAEFVYDCLTRTDDESMRILDNVINIVLPSINPDGTQMVGDWYMKYVGHAVRRHRIRPWLYQKYAGHDNNRDGFALNLPESKYDRQAAVSRLAAAGLHGPPPDGQRQRAHRHAAVRRADSPGRRSAGVARDRLVWRRTWLPSSKQAGKTGVIGNAIYSGWGHMGFHWITPFHNIAGMLNESASARLATPMYMHPDQLRGDVRGLPEYAAQTIDAEPLARRLVARPRHRREAEDRRRGRSLDLAARNRETRAVEHVPERHAPDRARR